MSLKVAREILLDVLWQACGEVHDTDEPCLIDNMCISSYEAACEYLHKFGMVDKINDRMYKLKNQKG